MKLLVAAAVLAALALAGCSSTPSGPTTLQPTDGKYVIRFTDSAFVPRDVFVPVGATVAWVSGSNIAHDVSAVDGSWSSDQDLGKNLGPQDRYERTFATAGTIEYHCKIHSSSGMKGTLVVG